MNIFIVEDSPLFAAALKKLIVKLGHKVAGVSESYEDAVIKINADVDLVIMDIMLVGNKDGIELGAYINEHFNIPIIYQSSVTDSVTVCEAMRNHPIAYLVKPVRKVALLTALLGADCS